MRNVFNLVGRVTPCAPSFASSRSGPFIPLTMHGGLLVLPFAIAAVRASRYAPRVDLPVRKKLPHTVPQWVSRGQLVLYHH
jgi:hypothetical protein